MVPTVPNLKKKIPGCSPKNKKIQKIKGIKVVCCDHMEVHNRFFKGSTYSSPKGSVVLHGTF